MTHPDDEESPVNRALRLAFDYGTVDGDHHRTWLIDQMVRVLTGEDYERWVEAFNVGDDDPDANEWPTGIAP